MYAWQHELSAAEFQAALDAAKQDSERVRKEFVASLPADSPAYDAEWTTRYGSKDRLIFVFSVVLDLDGEDFDIRDYPGEAAYNATADLRRRISGTKVGKWGVFVVTVTGRPDRHPMIAPDGLLGHAEQLACAGGVRPAHAVLRRGISAAY